jgi:hypothetical protein
MVAHQHSREDEGSSGSGPELERQGRDREGRDREGRDRESGERIREVLLPPSNRAAHASPEKLRSPAPRLDDAQFDPHGAGLEPRMQALAISNDALLDSLRPVAPPSIAGWIKKRANPGWQYVEYGYTEAAYWLWARAPWQRWALSGGLGALLGVAIVVVALPRLRPDLGSDLKSVAAASGDALVASTQVAAASAVLIAPLRQVAEPPVADVVKAVEPPPAADAVKLAEPDVPTAVEVSEQVDEDTAAPESGKSKRKARHGKRRAKAKNASSLSQLFLNIHRSSSRAKSSP